MDRIKDVAQQLDVVPATIRRWIKQGRIHVVRLPKRGYRITNNELNRLMSETPLTK
jgi:excisionase family DNA binding protein